MKTTNKKTIAIFVVFLSATITLSGCAQLRDKFVRKPKEEPTSRRYNVVRAYDIKPSLELYTKRYVFWKTWHEELLNVLSHESHKKTVTAIEQCVSNLMDMKNMLVDEKGDVLQKSIDEMSEIEMTIKKERLTAGNATRVKQSLESLERKIKREFSYTKVRGFLRDDFRRQTGS